jgi:hypothetical protein
MELIVRQRTSIIYRQKQQRVQMAYGLQTDLLGLVTIIVTTLLCKQVNKSGKASTLAA